MAQRGFSPEKVSGVTGIIVTPLPRLHQGGASPHQPAI